MFNTFTTVVQGKFVCNGEKQRLWVGNLASLYDLLTAVSFTCDTYLTLNPELVNLWTNVQCLKFELIFGDKLLLCKNVILWLRQVAMWEIK